MAAESAQIVDVVPSPETIGEAFARQYYTILHLSPEVVFRFYQNTSRMSRVDRRSGLMAVTTTMEAIDAKIQSYGSLKAEIKSVDAQESLDGGVIVVVTGSMVNEDASRRNFCQTFLLAPQEKGYYVLNDIFRYVDDIPDIIEEHSTEESDGGIVPITSSQEEAPPVADIPVSEQSNGEVCNPCENGEVSVVEEREEVQVKKEDPVAEVVHEAPQESWVMVESNAKVVDTPKKSYASIVMKEAPASPSHQKSVSKVQDRPVPAAPASISVASSPSFTAENVGNIQATEGEGHSLYARNLPPHVQMSVVEKAFQRFGPIKSGGVQIRHSKGGFCYAFVEFETADAARSAIEAASIIIEDNKVTMEEKRSTATRGNSFGGNNRGRYPPGRGGSGFRGEGGRGRGIHGGGRGYGSGESNKGEYAGRGGGKEYQNRYEQGESYKSEYGGRGGGREYYNRHEQEDSNKSEYGGRGGGRVYQNRQEGYQRSDQTGNRSGRMNRGGGSGFVSAKAPRVAVQA